MRSFGFARLPGAWSAVKTMCFPPDTIVAGCRENRRDLLIAGVIVITQLTVYVFAVSIVTRTWTQAGVLLAVVTFLSPATYRQW